MNRKTISMVVRALAAGAMVAGLSAVVSSAASAANGPNPTTYYASPNGNPGFAPCTNKHSPCNLAEALTEEAAFANGQAGSLVSLAKGTYNADISADNLTAGNNNVVISGPAKGKKLAVLAPSSYSGAGIVDLSNNTGIQVENLSIIGGTNSFNAFSLNQAPIVNDNNVGGTDTIGPKVTLSDAPNAPVGILMTDGITNVISTTETTSTAVPACTTTTITTKPEPSAAQSSNGWTAPGFLKIKSLPKCAHKNLPAAINISTNPAPPAVSAHVYVGSYTLEGKALELTTNDTECSLQTCAIPVGSTVTFAAGIAAAPAFNTVGIACAGPATCNVSGPGGASTTVNCTTVANPTGPGEVGVLASAGATAKVTGTTIASCSNSDASIPADEMTGALPGEGIALIPNPVSGTGPASATLGAGNTESGNDLGIIIEGNPSGGTGTATDTITGGSYGGTTAAMDVAASWSTAGGCNPLGQACVNLSASGSTFAGQSVGLSQAGAGVVLSGAIGESIGGNGVVGPGALAPNTISGLAGVVVGGLFTPSDVLDSSSNNVSYNNITNGTAGGIVIAGPETPVELLGFLHQPSESTTTQNYTTINHDTFSSNGTGGVVNGANIVNFNENDNPGCATLCADVNPQDVAIQPSSNSTTGWGSTLTVKTTNANVVICAGTSYRDTASGGAFETAYVVPGGPITGSACFHATASNQLVTLSIGTISSLSLINFGNITAGDTLAANSFANVTSDSSVIGPNNTVTGSAADPLGNNCNGAGLGALNQAESRAVAPLATASTGGALNGANGSPWYDC